MKQQKYIEGQTTQFSFASGEIAAFVISQNHNEAAWPSTDMIDDKLFQLNLIYRKIKEIKRFN